MNLEIVLLLKIGAVFALLVSFLYGLRRIVGHTPTRGRGLIRIVETRAVAQNQTLYLVQVGQQSFLLGGSRESLTLLTEVAELALPAEQAARDVAQRAFDDWRKAPSRCLARWWCHFRARGCGSPGSNVVDQA